MPRHDDKKYPGTLDHTTIHYQVTGNLCHVNGAIGTAREILDIAVVRQMHPKEL